MKKIALFGLAMLAACTSAPMLDQPTAIATLRFEAATGAEASASIDSRDNKPAWARLYVVPAAHAGEAQRAISASGGKLGRWALFPVVSQPMDGQTRQKVRLVPPSGAVGRGDLLVLAIDPISPGRFVTSGARIEQRGARGEVN